MKKFAGLAATLLLISVQAYGQTCVRHVERAGNFSYCPPSDWQPRESTSKGPYKSYFTPTGKTPIANMNVKEEISRATNDAYLTAGIKTMLSDNATRGSEARKLISWTSFKTMTGITGGKVIFESALQGNQLATVQYIIDLPTKKILLTFTTLQRDRADLDAIFDATARSFKIGG